MNNCVACIILNYNNYEDTLKCVNNILEKECHVDIVIVDNNSDNDSYEILLKEYKDIKNLYVVKNSSNTGYSAGNNYGIKFIINKNKDVRYLCIMNPDTLFDNPHLLEKLKTKMDSIEDVAIIAPVMYLRGEKTIEKTCWLLPNNRDFIKRLFIYYKNKTNNQFLKVEDDIAYTEALHGSFFMIRREVLERIGFFDENLFLYSEENMIGFQVKELGKKEILCLDEYYFHNHPIQTKRLSLKEKLKKSKIASNSRMYICKKYYPKYLYPVALVCTKLNATIIVVTHICGNVFGFFRKG